MLILTRSHRIDWPRMRANLRQLGVSDLSLAEAIGCSPRSIGYWGDDGATGEPAFWAGAAWIAFWCERTGLSWTDVPMRTMQESVSEVLREAR